MRRHCPGTSCANRKGRLERSRLNPYAARCSSTGSALERVVRVRRWWKKLRTKKATPVQQAEPAGLMQWRLGPARKAVISGRGVLANAARYGARSSC
jgi:hypothetical protein